MIFLYITPHLSHDTLCVDTILVQEKIFKIKYKTLEIVAPWVIDKLVGEKHNRLYFTHQNDS